MLLENIQGLPLPNWIGFSNKDSAMGWFLKWFLKTNIMEGLKIINNVTSAERIQIPPFLFQAAFCFSVSVVDRVQCP